VVVVDGVDGVDGIDDVVVVSNGFDSISLIDFLDWVCKDARRSLILFWLPCASSIRFKMSRDLGMSSTFVKCLVRHIGQSM
jgi:hypothetical protein